MWVFWGKRDLFFMVLLVFRIEFGKKYLENISGMNGFKVKVDVLSLRYRYVIVLGFYRFFVV